MMNHPAPRHRIARLSAGLVSLAPLLAAAHEGHGEPGVFHWHATDAIGFAMALGVVAAMLWWGRRK